MNKKYIYAFVTVLIWSTLAAVVKKILSDIPNLEALSISSFLACGFLFAVNLKNGSIRKLRTYTLKDYGIMSPSSVEVLGKFRSF